MVHCKFLYRKQYFNFMTAELILNGVAGTVVLETPCCPIVCTAGELSIARPFHCKHHQNIHPASAEPGKLDNALLTTKVQHVLCPSLR